MMIYPMSVALSVVPAKAGTQSGQYRARGPGPRLRGGDGQGKSLSFPRRR
jgi:hypothetical protein